MRTHTRPALEPLARTISPPPEPLVNADLFLNPSMRAPGCRAREPWSRAVLHLRRRTHAPEPPPRAQAGCSRRTDSPPPCPIRCASAPIHASRRRIRAVGGSIESQADRILAGRACAAGLGLDGVGAREGIEGWEGLGS
jgi:hypothetical protein